MANELLSYILALVVGLSLGLTGGGGSILTVPILVYISGIEPVLATGYSLFIVGVTSFVGMLGYFKEKLVDIKLAILFSVPSMLTVWLVRRFVVHNLPNELLQIGTFTLTKDTALMSLFALVMILSAVKMIWFSDKADSEKIEQPNFKVAIGSGVVVGILSGLIGAGGGFLIVPAITLYLGLPVHLAIGTSLLIISLNSLVGFTGDFQHLTDIQWPYLLEFSLIAVIGVLAGVYIGKLTNAKKLKTIFGWFVLSLAIVIIINIIK